MGFRLVGISFSNSTYLWNYRLSKLGPIFGQNGIYIVKMTKIQKLGFKPRLQSEVAQQVFIVWARSRYEKSFSQFGVFENFEKKGLGHPECTHTRNSKSEKLETSGFLLFRPGVPWASLHDYFVSGKDEFRPHGPRLGNSGFRLEWGFQLMNVGKLHVPGISVFSVVQPLIPASHFLCVSCSLMLRSMLQMVKALWKLLGNTRKQSSENC